MKKGKTKEELKEEDWRCFTWNGHRSIDQETKWNIGSNDWRHCSVSGEDRPCGFCTRTGDTRVGIGCPMYDSSWVEGT